MTNRCYFGLPPFLKSNDISREIKVKIYEILIRPVLTYGSETWTLSRSDEAMLGCFERKILKRIFGATQESGMWRRYNFELYRLYKEPHIVKTIKLSLLRWIGYVMKMDVDDPVRKTLLEKPVGQRRRGGPRTRFLGNVEEDLRNIGIRAWRRKAMDRDAWKNVLKEAEAHLGL
jgi:hypothetical protein